jgi:hypothetical protein
MLIKDAIAFIDDLAEELDTEIGKLWEEGHGELSVELTYKYHKFEAIKEMLEKYYKGYHEGYLDGVRDGKQIMFNKLQEFVEGE